MANGLNSIVKREANGDATKMGSRRIFTPHFKLQVLDSYRQDADCKGNQRATARKYGIHRRQIQKWLQAENSLRGSVNGITKRGAEEEQGGDFVQRATTLDCGRQGGAVVSNAISRDVWKTTNLSCVTPSTSPTCNSDASDLSLQDRLHNVIVPIDLSLKKFTSEPIDVSSISVPTEYETTRLYHNVAHNEEILDLTCRKRKISEVPEVSSSTEPSNVPVVPESPPAKVVKLFKPYLLCDEKDKEDKMAAVISKTTAVVTTNVDVYNKYDTWHMNNNIITNTQLYPLDCYNTTYAYNYQYYPNSHEQIRYSPCYDSASSFSPSSCCDEDYPSLSNEYDMMSVRQRQTYTVDFKLSAIDSYYRDMECRGNQRAVANKFCIHRRQIQKWLKQEDILRQRLESSPPLT